MKTKPWRDCKASCEGKVEAACPTRSSLASSLSLSDVSTFVTNALLISSDVSNASSTCRNCEPSSILVDADQTSGIASSVGASRASYKSLLPQTKHAFLKQFSTVEALTSDPAPNINCTAINRLIFKSGCSLLVRVVMSINKTKLVQDTATIHDLKIGYHAGVHGLQASRRVRRQEKTSMLGSLGMKLWALQLSRMSAIFFLDRSMC